MPPSSNPAPTGTPRPAIADLLKVASRYRFKPTDAPTGSDMNRLMAHEFVLVDESQHDNTRDELILLIGDAYPEFVSLAKELHTVKADYVAACDVVRAMHQAILGGKAAQTESNPVEDAGNLRSRFMQGIDVFKSLIATNRTPEQIQFIIVRYLDSCRRVGSLPETPENVTPLVNENEQGAPSATASH